MTADAPASRFSNTRLLLVAMTGDRSSRSGYYSILNTHLTLAEIIHGVVETADADLRSAHLLE